MVWNQNSGLFQQVHYWRTRHGVEVDFVVPLGNGKLLSELTVLELGAYVQRVDGGMYVRG